MYLWKKVYPWSKILGRGDRINMKKKKRKYGIWLSNYTDSRDDSWIFVYASSSKEASAMAKHGYLYDNSRFSIRDIMPVKEFRKWYGV